MILCDSHLHSSFSSDSSEEARKVIEKAIGLGMPFITFTDHNDFDWPIEDGHQDFQIDFDSYLSTMKDLKETYKDKIEILIGLEQGLIESRIDDIENYDKNNDLDFIIGSMHLLAGQDPYYPEFWQGKSCKSTLQAYFSSSLEIAKNIHNFDVFGHIDYIARYIPDKSFVYKWQDYYDQIKDLLMTLIESGKGIEINSSGLKYKMPDTNPCLDIVKLYRKLGGEIITIGSDAHKAEHIAYRFDRSAEILDLCGFKYYTRFVKRKAEFIKI